MCGGPTATGAAGGTLATTGIALQSWILAGVGLVVLGCTLLLVTARRRRRS